jgi:hypothetical protein
MSGPLTEAACSYFTWKRACPDDGVKPVALKSGKCLFHTTGSHDHDNDWMECYEGCLKHDPDARRKVRDRNRKKAKQRSRQIANNYKPRPEAPRRPNRPIPVPSIARLERIVLSYPPDEANAKIRELLYLCIVSRQNDQDRRLSFQEIASYYDVHPESFSLRWNMSRQSKTPNARAVVYFSEVIQITNYIRDWDKAQVARP